MIIAVYKDKKALENNNYFMVEVLQAEEAEKFNEAMLQAELTFTDLIQEYKD